MRTSVERLRIGLLVGAGLLVLVIAAFLGYARYRVGRVIANLPGKLGATITKESNGYTWSQSDGKRTIFTIHAAKVVEHSNGKYTLHDMSMILYGRSGDRADRISGDDFEYDTEAQVVTAIGVVHLDLDAEAPGAADSDARKHMLKPAADGHDNFAVGSRVVHVKTSGLVYTKQSGTATTDQALEFAFSGYTGHAVGAEYNATTGHVMLQSAITLSGLDKGRPIAMSAAHGELDRVTRLAEFKDARYSSAGQVAGAEMAQIHMREDNSIERVDCFRQVVLEDGERGKVTSTRAEVALDAANKPTAAVFTGGVRFTQSGTQREARGESNRAELKFDGQGHLDHALMQGSVKAAEHLRSAASSTDSQRTLTSDTLELWLAAEEKGSKPQLRDAKATGSVRFLTTDAKGASRKFTGDLVSTHFVSVNGRAEITTMHGSGHTSLEQTGVDAIYQQSTGETLDAKFRPDPAGGKTSAELASAVQQGNVAIERRIPSRSAGAPMEVQHATAKLAAFDANTNTLTLSGAVAMKDPGRQVLAEQVMIAQGTGDATATGGVRVTYQQAGLGEPAHVLAARAELNRSAGRTTFYGRGAGNGSARLWQAGAGGQGGSQIEAPVLVLEEVNGVEKDSRLTARAETSGVQGQVHAVLAESRGSESKVQPGETPHIAMQAPGTARIVSSEMVYSDLEHKATFSGGVHLTDGTVELKAQDAVVFLAVSNDSKPAGASEPPASGGLLGGHVERIVATQHVELTQPARRATGDRLVYTALDKMFVLTGTAGAPPRVVDAEQGSATGAELRFHSGDKSVVIAGTDGDSPARKVQTETRVKQH